MKVFCCFSFHLEKQCRSPDQLKSLCGPSTKWCVVGQLLPAPLMSMKGALSCVMRMRQCCKPGFDFLNFANFCQTPFPIARLQAIHQAQGTSARENAGNAPANAVTANAAAASMPPNNCVTVDTRNDQCVTNGALLVCMNKLTQQASGHDNAVDDSHQSVEAEHSCVPGNFNAETSHSFDAQNNQHHFLQKSDVTMLLNSRSTLPLPN